MKVRAIIRQLLDDGWVRLAGRGKGSHRVFHHPPTGLIVTVPSAENDDLPVGTLRSIQRVMADAKRRT